MKLSPEEKAAQKAAFRAMSPDKKMEHILTYYKWLILLVLVVLFVLGSVLQRELTKKEPVLQLALINVAVGEDLENALTADFITYDGGNPRRQEVYLYRDLYISEDADTLNHEYAYASQMKLMGAIQSQKLDLVIMNREGFDILSQKGYLAELPALLETDPDLAKEFSPLLVENEVVLSDNSLDVLLGEAEDRELVTQSVPNAIALSSLPLFENAGFGSEIYLGLLANSPHADAALRYLRYLSSAGLL